MLLVLMICERMRWAYSTSSMRSNYYFSIKVAAISLISPYLLCFYALSYPSISLSDMSASSREINSVLSLACWSEIALASFRTPVKSLFNFLS